jgi:hypothetical protein
MEQICIKYTIIFHYKTLQNLPKWGFLVWKQTIWQTCRDWEGNNLKLIVADNELEIRWK